MVCLSIVLAVCRGDDFPRVWNPDRKVSTVTFFFARKGSCCGFPPAQWSVFLFSLYLSVLSILSCGKMPQHGAPPAPGFSQTPGIRRVEQMQREV